MDKYVISPSLSPEDIRQAREKLDMTRAELASFIGCSARTIEYWETKADKITGPVVTLLEILLRKPAWVEKLTVPPPRGKVRVWYMHRHMVCSLIDVDEQQREIYVRDYVDDPLYRAFGVNPAPDFEDYENFLASRCFPPTRDKLKLELKMLDIPFYDPMMIIEKTDGRMADDQFWLKVERTYDTADRAEYQNLK